jgi:hypothetical protein
MEDSKSSIADTFGLLYLGVIFGGMSVLSLLRDSFIN